MFGIPSWATILGALVVVGALCGYSYYLGRVSGDAACATATNAQHLVDMAEQAMFAKKKFDELDARYKMAIESGKKAGAALTESQREITRLTFTLTKALGHDVQDIAECRVPVSIIRALNSLRRPDPTPAQPGPSSASGVPTPG